MEKVVQIVAIIVLFFALLMGISLALAFPVKWLWNWLMPAIFGLPVISVWKAWGLNMLCGILFKQSTSSSSSE